MNLSGHIISGLIHKIVPFGSPETELMDPATMRVSPKSAKHARRCLLIKKFN